MQQLQLGKIFNNMHASQIIALMRGEAQFNDKTLTDLSKITQQYPYFQTAHLLYTLNLYYLEDAHFLHELRKTATYLNDRRQLFFIIENWFFDFERIEALQHQSHTRPSSVSNFSHNVFPKSKEKHFQIEEVDDFVEDTPNYLEETPDYTEEMADYSKKTSYYIDKAPDFTKRAPDFTKRTPDYSKRKPHYTEEMPDYSKRKPHYTEEILDYPEDTTDYLEETSDPIEETPNYTGRKPHYTEDTLDYPEETPDQTEEVQLFSYAPTDYAAHYLSENREEFEEKAEEPKSLQYQDTIDRFLEKDEVSPIKIELKTTDKTEETVAPVIEEVDDSDFFSETLAKIYIKQRKYKKALEIIHKIILFYPEKSSYFADQIQMLEDLININKNKTK